MMMIMGRNASHSNPTVQVPPWDDEMVQYDDLEAGDYDDFRMYEFKVRRCARGRSHDWTECPYAHPGEKARRRDPRKFQYSGNPCPEFRKGACERGDACEFAHGVFECWLHPSRYRTQPCKDGVQCRRRICFFAHNHEQLRVMTGSTHYESYDGSPGRLAMGKGSPTSTLYPPMSPDSVSELAGSIRNMQIRSVSMLRPVTRNPNPFDIWDEGVTVEEPMMERVESGRDLRARIYAKLGRENSFAGEVVL